MELRGYTIVETKSTKWGAMTVEVMAKVERRYSRKVGDSFRRDREHLALFEELSMHEDLDSSLGDHHSHFNYSRNDVIEWKPLLHSDLIHLRILVSDKDMMSFF